MRRTSGVATVLDVTDPTAPLQPGPSGRRILPKGFELVDGAGEAPAGFEFVDAAATSPPLPPIATPRAVVARPFVLHRAPVTPDQGGNGAACGGGCLLLVGLVSLGLFLGLFHVGQLNRWTSDGPGMLYVMIGVLGFGLLTVMAFGSALTAALGSVLRRDR